MCWRDRQKVREPAFIRCQGRKHSDELQWIEGLAQEGRCYYIRWDLKVQQDWKKQRQETKTLTKCNTIN